MVELEVRLITPADYPTSGMPFPDGTISEYVAIGMPGGGVMHKPENTIRVAPGDPDRVTFELKPKFGHGPISLIDGVTLRLLSRGLRRDIPLRLTPKR
jgi:hypothetical protein